MEREESRINLMALDDWNWMEYRVNTELWIATEISRRKLVCHTALAPERA